MYCIIAQIGVDIIDVYGPFEDMKKAMQWTLAVDHPDCKVSWYMTELTSPDVLTGKGPCKQRTPQPALKD